jgi:DNA-binding HxlR family transcriptional regulator
MDSGRRYRHFCMMARALEVVGERWSLLIVRELLLGPRRFTDLARCLAGITPTRLTDRLRHLETVGVVARQQPSSGREVRYQLTEAGRDLEPVVEALALWGMAHAFERPRAGEPVCAAPAMIGSKAWLSKNVIPPHPVAWVWRFPADGPYTLRFTEGAWTVSPGEAADADVSIDSTPEAWAHILTAPPGSRRAGNNQVRITGEPGAVREFAEAFGLDPSAI